MESVTDQQQFDERLDKMNKGVEQIIEDGRKRQYSSWRSDFLAILIVVSGLFAVILSSWRADIRRLK